MATIEEINRIAQVIKDYLIENGFSSLDLTEGSPLYEVLVRGLAVSLASLNDYLLATETKLYLTPDNLETLDSEQLERLAANFLVPVFTGGRATVVARVYFSDDIKPDSITILRTNAFYTKNGLAFYPVADQTFNTFQYDAATGYWYIEVLLEAEADGDEYQIGPNELNSASGFTYSYVTNPAPASGGASPDTVETIIEKINIALTTREIATRNAVAYMLNSDPNWRPDAYLVVGQRDIELQRDVLGNIKTGHAADIYYYKANATVQEITETVDVSTLPSADPWLNGFYYKDVKSEDQVSGITLGAFKITDITVSGGPILSVNIGSYYGRGTYGKGPFGVGNACDIYIRNLDPFSYKSARSCYRIYFNPLLASSTATITYLQNQNITSIQEYLDNNVVFIDYLVKEFLEAEPIISITVKQGKEEIDVNYLKTKLKETIESIPPSQGLDQSALTAVIENEYPTSYIESYNTYQLRQEHPKGFRFLLDFGDKTTMIPKELPEFGVTPRLYRFVVKDLDNIEVILK